MRLQNTSKLKQMVEYFIETFAQVVEWTQLKYIHVKRA